MGKLFGTDGIRGRANVYPMTVEMAMAVGKAVAVYFGGDRKPGRFLIGKDTRISGDMLEQALSAGLSSMGADVALVGVLPTPGIAHMVASEAMQAGVVISASHNPFSTMASSSSAVTATSCRWRRRPPSRRWPCRQVWHQRPRPWTVPEG